jgi:sigma-B regulation protein RsbU (phosphoserine phosphatase)
MAMLPGAMPAVPGLEIAAHLTPAQSVGGDLYDVLVAGDRLWFIVADVAGKSIAAALYMAIARALFRATARGAATAAEVATRMNEELSRDNERMMFVTAAIGCLDLRRGTLSLVDAGHTPALLAGGSGVRELPGVPKGMALGVNPDAPYIAAELPVLEGTLVLYTDGASDARDPTGEMFGESRLLAAIAAADAESPEALVAGVVRAVERFASGAAPEDDLTLLAVRYREPR